MDCFIDSCRGCVQVRPAIWRLVALLLAFVCHGTPKAALASDTTLPEGNDAAASIQRLKIIKEGYRANRAALTTVHAAGKVGISRIPFDDQQNAITKEDFSAPKWRSFDLLEVDGKGRYEEEFQVYLLDNSPQTIYRVMNERGFARLDGPGFYILSPGQSPNLWFHSVGAVYRLTVANDGATFDTLDVICDLLIARLAEGPVVPGEGIVITAPLRCIGEDHTLIVESRFERPDDGCVGGFRFVVDPAQGYNLTRMDIVAGGRGLGIDHGHRVEVVYAEVLPGIFFPKAGWSLVSNKGEVDKRDDRAGFMLEQFLVETCETSNIEVSPSAFDWTALPIPKGAYVEDRRVSPPLTFRYGREPLDEQLMKAALGNRSDEPAPVSSGRRWWLIGGNVVLLLAISAIVAFRAWRRSRKRTERS